MAETRLLPIIEEDEIGNEFYEKIEAPKFVDFTTPDTHRPDDRYWFCLRVGCDQKHEEELDSEAIYKNFVLRVMAARSPNIRLRKALNKREASANLKCPLTAPPKPSKSRASTLALISSMSKKMVENNGKARALSKASATPNAKVKQSSAMAKALTTPRNQKKISNPEQYRTVQTTKAMSVVVPKNKVVAKALVFHSPKKVERTKGSVELKTPVKTLCSAMKKLELKDVKKNEERYKKPLQIADSRKQFRGREVKSGVFDSLYSKRGKGQETSPARCLKDKKLKGLQKCKGPQLPEGTDNDSSNMEVDEKSRAGSPEKFPESATTGGSNEASMEAVKSQVPTIENSVEVSVDTCRGDKTSLPNSVEAENETSHGCENEEKRKPISEQEKIPEAINRNDKENAFLASNDKENAGELNEDDEKENASAPDENRALRINDDHPKKTILSSKHENSRKNEKKSTSTANGSQVLKYRKLKPTNPKPFKLRTDERGILKEANLEKKAMSPMKDATAKRSNAMRKHPNKNETFPGQSEHETDNYDGCKERSDQVAGEDQSGSIRNAGYGNSDRKVKCKLSATRPNRSAGLKLQEPINRRAEFVRPRGALSRKKDKVLLATPRNLSVLNEKSSNIVQPKEATKPCDNGASPRSKATGATSRRKRVPTVPKEPNFHRLHVPKNCARKLTSEQRRLQLM